MMHLGFNGVKQEWAVKFADDIRLRALTNKGKFQNLIQKVLGDLEGWINSTGDKLKTENKPF